ncbi:glucose-6-phosphate isomerase [Sporobacter termitidis DSM 10068]|uniref:Glucose-6-phosphate isomerase n=1 Tax=Sporobacter termitidis DSM 10068 TaxID=1123282 RepID=A0A1M5YFW8_9FIRM|nr:glucose-6-phosphate isomerase [Sporobacter termitidis]SHI10784.1 glucose-6-phosphate isomerase [Sporobacter termitidis DSM 10068]
MIKTDLTGALSFIDEKELPGAEDKKALTDLLDGKIGRGGAGWLRLPEDYSDAVSAAIRSAAYQIADNSEVLVVIGIGGSYLGARAALDLLRTPYYNQIKKRTPDIYFAGNNLSGEYLEQVIALIGGRNFSVNYVSKSGATMEPSAAFRVFKNLLDSKYGAEGARKRIYTTTDGEKGKLRQLTDRKGYTSFAIPDDIGGRYSVLTAVGLLPAAVAGIDIDELMSGARDIMNKDKDDVLQYASARQALYRQGKKIEILGCFEPSFRSMGEWWKQLFGESEGKDGRGIFPVYTEFTTDLHSLGQYIQSGERSLFETFVSIEKTSAAIRVPKDGELEDGLETLAGRELQELNRAAFAATKAAHNDGGVPVIQLDVPQLSPYYFGALVQFFELSCAVSALISKVNPFDQPGVEAYKKNMYAILGLQK